MQLFAAYQGFRKEACKLLDEFLYSCPRGARTCNLIEHHVQSDCVVRLYDAWARFNRRLIFDSACARPMTANGTRLRSVPGVNSRNDVIPALRSAKGGRLPLWWEPKWGRSMECLGAARLLKIQNIGTVAAAIGASNSPAEKLRVTRNYFAHRNMETAQAVQQLMNQAGTLGLRHPREFVSSYVSGGVSVYESWVLDLLDIAEAAVQ